MNISISNYSTLIFDCDGVVLDSNKVKTRAFHQAALLYGKDKAQALVDYHLVHGGISRYEKFGYFLKHIVGIKEPCEDELNELLKSYAKEVWEGLATCKIACGLRELRKKTSNSRWLLVSGGDQEELRGLFFKREIAHLFDGGIFGSPDDKEHILKRESENGNIQRPALFIGDSKYDYLAATSINLEFIFVTGWSEFGNWIDFFKDKGIVSVDNIKNLI